MKSFLQACHNSILKSVAQAWYSWWTPSRPHLQTTQLKFVAPACYSQWKSSDSRFIHQPPIGWICMLFTKKSSLPAYRSTNLISVAQACYSQWKQFDSKSNLRPVTVANTCYSWWSSSRRIINLPTWIGSVIVLFSMKSFSWTYQSSNLKLVARACLLGKHLLGGFANSQPDIGGICMLFSMESLLPNLSKFQPEIGSAGVSFSMKPLLQLIQRPTWSW